MSDAKSPFFTVLTRTYKRKIGFTNAIQSVMDQSCSDIEHIFILDESHPHPEGNIKWASTQLGKNKHRIDGKYVFILDDDGVMVDKDFFERAKKHAEGNGFPDVILNKTISLRRKKNRKLEPFTLPPEGVWNLDWENGERPKKFVGNGYCITVRSDIWKKYVHNYSHSNGGDWHFITSMIVGDCDFSRLDAVAAKSTQRGYGRIFEDNCEDDWFFEVAAKFGIKNLDGEKDWRIRYYDE